MTLGLRRFVFTAHVTSSVGWLGVVVAYLALAITGLAREDAAMVRASYLAMELIGWSVIVSLSLAALLTGLVQSLGTEWGLFRHYWITVKFALTVIATTVLVAHMPSVSRMSALAAATILATGDYGPQRVQLIVHAAGGLVVLLAATALSIYKPWGRTPYGKRLQRASESGAAVERGASWGLYVLTAIIGLFVLLIVRHLAGGGMHAH